MRTLLFLAGGIALWAIITGIARVIASQAGNGWVPTIVFAVIWFMIASWNMWVGVTQAGYTVMEELPIFLLLYLFPVAVVVAVKYKFLQ